jgi:hypothetical protein
MSIRYDDCQYEEDDTHNGEDGNRHAVSRAHRSRWFWTLSLGSGWFLPSGRNVVLPEIRSRCRRLDLGGSQVGRGGRIPALPRFCESFRWLSFCG